VTASVLDELIARYDEETFERPSGPWQVSLPDDLGGHPDMRSETWTIAAHLEDESGAPVGMTFSLSRFGLRAQASATDGAQWDIRAVYRAHVTLVRDGEPAALGEERFSRGAGVAGDDRAAREVWLDHWQLTYGAAPDGDGLTLTASVDGLPIELRLTPVKGAQPADGGDAAPLRGFAIAADGGRGRHRRRRCRNRRARVRVDGQVLGRVAASRWPAGL
jgi:predicted secreted hydrolase